MPHEYIDWPGAPEDDIVITQYHAAVPVHRHKHEYIEIVFIIEGSCKHHYLGHEENLAAGHVFIVTPHEEHSYEISAQAKIINCMLFPWALDGKWEQLGEMSGLYNFIVLEPFFRFETKSHTILHFSPDEMLRAWRFLDEIMREQKNRAKGYRLMQQANLICLLGQIGRKWEQIFAGMAVEYNHKRILVEEAMAYIAANLQEELSIQKIAERSFLSPDYFRRLFKQETGSSPIKYINQLRVEKAKKLLKDTNMQIGEIACCVGTHDLNYFSKLFYANVGCTPTLYRESTEKCE